MHIFGYPCDIEAITAIAARHGIPVVEDACEALGCTRRRPRRRHARQPGGVRLLPNKQITTGEGGMITTDDPDVARELRSIVNQGRSDNGDWLVHQRLGFNYRMDEMSAAVGLAQLEKLESSWSSGARPWPRATTQLLAGIAGVELPYRGPQQRSWFIYYVRLRRRHRPRRRDRRRWPTAAIASRPYLPGDPPQPEYRERCGCGEGMLPVTERVSRSTLALPFFVQLEDDDIDLRLRARCARCSAEPVMAGGPMVFLGYGKVRARRPHLRDGADRATTAATAAARASGSTGSPSR